MAAEGAYLSISFYLTPKTALQNPRMALADPAIELPETRGVPLPETLADCAVHGDAKAKIREAE